MPSKIDCVGFWTRFAVESTNLFDQIIGGELAEAYRKITWLLESSACPYVCEVTHDDTNGILVFTPESDPELAKEIDDFVLLAPELPKWIIFSRRQRKPVEDVFEILNEIYRVDARSATFSVSQENGRWNVIMHTAVADEMTPNEAAGFVDMFLEHALGEEAAMTQIGHRSITSASDPPGLIPQKFIVQILGE